VTHAHSDHASGSPALAARWPRAAFGKLPWPERDARWAVPWQALADGEELDAGDVRLRVLHTPGHSPDHVSLFEPETRTLFCGDLAVAGSTVVIPGGRGGDLAAYLKSLDRVLALGPDLLLPAHGRAVHDPARVIASYISHRKIREDQIVASLQRGESTPESIVAEVYPNLRPELRDAAVGTVVAHLIKLRDEGRAVENPGGHWTPC
jgi:hydroxyacylglutathione hydrolase